MAQIITYFIETVAGNEEKAKDFKSLWALSYQMYKEEHVQKILLKSGFETVIIHQRCEKNSADKIVTRIHHTSGEIQFAKCGCVAGKDSRISCKHITSLCYALENFSWLFLHEPKEIACTNLLQKWTQPRKRCISPKVNKLDFSIESHDKIKKTRYLQGRNPVEIVGNILENDVTAVQNLKSRLEAFQKQHPKAKPSMLSVLDGSSPISSSMSPPVSSIYMSGMLTDQWKVKPSWLLMEANFGCQFQFATQACMSVLVSHVTFYIFWQVFIGNTHKTYFQNIEISLRILNIFLQSQTK